MDKNKENPDFYGCNDGLEEWEIEERNGRLKEISEGLTQFLKNTQLNLTIKQFEMSLTPGIPSCVVYGNSARPTFGTDWIYNSAIPKIKREVIRAVTEKALETVGNETAGAYVLRGSATAVSKKLIMQNVLGVRLSTNGDSCWEDIEKMFLNAFSIELMSWELLNSVIDTYEEKYMRYRLWNKKSLSALADFLLFDHSSKRNNVELPAMAEDMEGDRLSQEKFIELASNYISRYTEPDGTEMSYPFFSKESYIFSEFIPLHLAEEGIKNRLYNWYLEAHESNK
ncbi:hypothetical protein [Zobellella taiwanensis]